jgi:hypothetical protein
MNFLQICQEANRLAGMQGTLSTVAVSSGYQEILVTYCKDAFYDLQEYRKDWPWMRSSSTFNTVASDYEYSLQDIVNLGNSIDIARYVPGGIYVQDLSSSERSPLDYLPYDTYLYRNIDQADTGTPSLYALDPVDKHIYINPPDQAYTIEVHYYTLPVTLDEDADIPLLPPAFHILISYMGAARMAGFMGNSGLAAELTVAADNQLGMLLRSENPGKRMIVRGAA